MIFSKKKPEPTPIGIDKPKFADMMTMKTESTKGLVNSKISPKLLISVLIILIAFVVAYFGGYNQYLKILKIKDSIVDQNTKLTKLSAQKDYLRGLADDRTELAGRQELAEQAVPLTDDVSNLMNQIIEMASYSGIKLDSLSFSGLANGDDSADFKKIVLRSTAKGTFPQLISFIKRIENSRRVLVISSLSYTPAVENPDDLSKQYSLSLNLTGFYLPEIDVTRLTIDQLTKVTDTGDIVIKLRSYNYYSVEGSDINLGNNENPFEITDAPTSTLIQTPSVVEIEKSSSNNSGGISPN